MSTLTEVELRLLKLIVECPRPAAMIPPDLRSGLSNVRDKGLIWLKGGSWTSTEAGENLCRKFRSD